MKNCYWMWYYGDYEIVGIWSGIEDDGRANRQIHPLRNGDVITPLYYRYDEDGTKVGTVEGESFTVRGYIDIDVTTLPEGDYRYSFLLTDVYQNQLLTDFTVFYVDKNGELYYYD